METHAEATAQIQAIVETTDSMMMTFNLTFIAVHVVEAQLIQVARTPMVELSIATAMAAMLTVLILDRIQNLLVVRAMMILISRQTCNAVSVAEELGTSTVIILTITSR